MSLVNAKRKVKHESEWQKERRVQRCQGVLLGFQSVSQSHMVASNALANTHLNSQSIQSIIKVPLQVFNLRELQRFIDAAHEIPSATAEFHNPCPFEALIDLASLLW